MAKIDPQKLPKHIAIIMDGNGRWAKSRSLSRIKGHEEGARSVRDIVRASREIGVQWLTLYAFSEENWRRPKYEIQALWRLLKRFLQSELEEMLLNGIRFHVIGRIYKLPKDVQKSIKETIEKTSANKDMTLTLALSYGARQEIVDTVEKIATQIETGNIGSGDVTEALVAENLYTANMPDPDLLIRTSGEFRISNFLLWQIAYAEIYVTPTHWPDFRRDEYFMALEEYQRRERRFGATGDQVARKRK